MAVKIVVLCAGKGTRMKSNKSKVMNMLMGKPLLEYIYDIGEEVTKEKPIFIVGHKKEEIIEYFKENAIYVEQKQQLGTGHAIKLVKDVIEKEDEVFILCGDAPLIREETLKNIVKEKKEKEFDAAIITSTLKDPFGYGRIIKNVNGDFERIVEEKDATDKEKKVTEINAGMYFLKGEFIIDYVDKIDNKNAQNEYYITDLFKILKDAGKNIITCNISCDEIVGINSRKQLEDARKIMQKRINDFHMDNGVTLINPDSIYIEKNVKIGKDTVIYPNNFIKGDSIIGENVMLYQENDIENSIIEDNAIIRKSFIESSFVGENTTVGPYSHLRPKSKLGKNVKVGNFVEIKNSNIGNKSKASHLAYVGDGDVGENVNIGCGVIFVNYDGKNKKRSVVKDNAFIGSNANLVAPVVVEEKGYVATGSTITKDVPKEALCVARAREVFKEGWVKDKGLLDK